MAVLIWLGVVALIVVAFVTEPARFFSPTHHLRSERLRGEVADLSRRIERLDEVKVKGLNPEDLGAVGALKDAKHHIKEAESFARKRNTVRGWMSYNAAYAAWARCLSEPELSIEAADVRRRTWNFPESTKDLMAHWLPDVPRKQPLADRRAGLAKACELWLGKWSHDYHKTDLISARILTALAVILLSAGGIMWATILGRFDLVPDGDAPHLVVAAFLVGTLSGAASSLRSIRVEAHGKILPEMAKDAPWHLLRGLVGGSMAILVVAVLSGGALGVQVVQPHGVYLVAAAAGFSETFVTNVLSRAAEHASGSSPGSTQPDRDGAGRASKTLPRVVADSTGGPSKRLISTTRL